jgi:hemolysin III
MKAASAEHGWLEELANSLSHGLAGLAALVACLVLLLDGRHQGAAGGLAGLVVFLCAAALIYLVSSLFHALPEGGAKRFMLKLDYCAIHVFIACSYTAFALIYSKVANVGGMAAVWGLAALGITISLAEWRMAPFWTAAYYLATGWLTLTVATSLLKFMPSHAALWLLIGCAVYSVGVLVYLVGARVRFSHLGWHLFVVAGSSCHFLALVQH